MTDRPTVNAAELLRLQVEVNGARTKATDEDVHDIAVAAMVVLRGLTRPDKFKVLRRMRRLMG